MAAGSGRLLTEGMMNANGGNEMPQTGSGSAQAGTETADFKAASAEVAQLVDELSRANAA